jgi:uncharacterized membrane-anchored protein YitT (DUF2179 family)
MGILDKFKKKPLKVPEQTCAEKVKTILFRLLNLTIGAAIVAFALEAFLIPNKIIDGGVIGVSMMLNTITGLNLGLLILGLNLPFIILAYTTIGKTFVFQTFYSVTMLAIFTNLSSGVIATTDPVLATAFGGIILGVGVGLILRNSASLDGTEILSIKLAKRFSFMSIGEFLMGFNLLIYTASGFLYSWNNAMYSIITYYIASKTIDVVITGFNSSKSVRIVSDYYKEIGDTIMKELDVSVTYMKTRGGYSGEQKMLTYCVVSRLEMSKVKTIVKSIDKKAFLVIEDVHEVEGIRVKTK